MESRFTGDNMDIQTLTNWLEDKYAEERAEGGKGREGLRVPHGDPYPASWEKHYHKGRLDVMEQILTKIGRPLYSPDNKNELKYKMPDGYNVDQGGVSSHPMDINEGSAWSVPSTDSPYPPSKN